MEPSTGRGEAPRAKPLAFRGTTLYRTGKGLKPYPPGRAVEVVRAPPAARECSLDSTRGRTARL